MKARVQVNMELLLNLVWLMVALAAFCGWLWQRKDMRQTCRDARLVWQVVALGIVLLFAFFAISISDDLHWTEIAAEAAEGTRKLVKPLASGGQASIPGIAFATLLFAPALLFARRKFGTLDRPWSLGSPASGWSCHLSSRSPPETF